MTAPRVALVLLALLPALHAASDAEGIDWLVEYQGGATPPAPWAADGLMKAEPGTQALHLSDESHDGFGFFRAPWQSEPAADREIVVEARVKMGAMTGGVKGKDESMSVWPWRDGSPVGLLISDGVHSEGLSWNPERVSTFSDRVTVMNTTKDFHTYRLVIRGTDMSLSVDGVLKLHGQNAFWNKAPSTQPFVQFGSNAKYATGDAEWASVRLGVRKPTAPAAVNPLKITVGELRQIPREKPKQTRPYLYNMGQGLLLMSVAQGPDALYEPYGVLRSTDAGQSWAPIEGLDQIEATPLPMLRMPDGSIVGPSRWTRTREDGALIGHTTYLDAKAEHFTVEESVITLPEQYTPKKNGDVLVFERQIFHQDDGSILCVAWTRISSREDGKRSTDRSTHFLRSTDRGRTWSHFARIGPGGESGVAYLSKTELVAMTRSGSFTPMTEMFSHDAGRTWSEPVFMEEGAVDPDLESMSNGVLACSFGRPVSSVMFSIDGGKSWCAHAVVTERAGFNYTSLREISPGRLLYMQDAAGLSGAYIDVERVK